MTYHRSFKTIISSLLKIAQTLFCLNLNCGMMELMTALQDLSHCTATGFRTLENRHKTLVFKELRRIWEKQDPNLPWEKGAYNESNTLLLDDSPYKALLNPVSSILIYLFPYFGILI